MHNKTVTILLLLTLTTLVAAAGPSAEPQDALEQAKQLADAGQYDQAEQFYQAVLADQPTGDQALAAQKGLAILYVRSGNDAEAKQALEYLIAGFSDHWDIARAVTHVADASRDVGKHNDAIETYGRVIAAWPDDEHALWSQMGIAISHASLKDAKASDAAVEELCTAWQGHYHLGRALCIVADNWRKLNNHEKARDIYNLALAKNPDPEFAMWSRMGLTISEVRLGDVESAEADADRLISDFAGDSRVSIAACLAADQFRAVGANAKAAELYNYVVDEWPQTEHAIWSQMGVAICHICTGDEIAGDADVEQLVSAFADRENLGQAVQQVAREYEVRQQHDKAERLRQRAIAAQQDADLGPLGKANIARLHIVSGDDQAAEAVFSQIMADYTDHPLLPDAIHLVAEGYYNQAVQLELDYRPPGPRSLAGELPERARVWFQNAIAKWQVIITELPETRYATAEAHYFCSECYRILGQPEMMVMHCDTVYSKWPDYERTWQMLFRLGRTYRHLKAAGAVPASEADPIMRSAFERILNSYGNSPAAKAARGWLKCLQGPEQGAEK